MRILKVSFLLFSLIFCSIFNAQTESKFPLKIYQLIKQKKINNIFELLDTTFVLPATQKTRQQDIEFNLTKFGKAKKLVSILEDDAGTKKKYALQIKFKKGIKTIYLTVNSYQKIEKIKLDDYVELPFYQLKGYKGFSEVTDLTTHVICTDKLFLGANIAFGDTSKRKLPVVVFVHGSGSSDRDETIGPNKPFRDLAQGLAQQGVASLRYDKRGYDYTKLTKQQIDSLDIYTETIFDAISAIKTLKQFTFIDTTKIYIVGHSQGAMCAPKIAELCGLVKGIIMLAGPAKNLVDVLPEQANYIAMLDDTITNVEEMQLNQTKWLVDKIKNPIDLKKLPKALFGGAGYKYWQSILNFNQVKTAQGLTIPVFILNGENDFQVIMSEFELWKTELKNNTNVTFKSYPKLNHLFLKTIGQRGVIEYTIPDHIPQYVIDDLVNFIK